MAFQETILQAKAGNKHREAVMTDIKTRAVSAGAVNPLAHFYQTPYAAIERAFSFTALGDLAEKRAQEIVI